MISKKNQINTIKICIKHNNKNIKITNKSLQKTIFLKNYSIFKKNKTVAFFILKKANLMNLLIKNA